MSRLEHVNRECFDRIDHLETDNHFHETQFDDRDAINRARVRQIWRTAETVVQDNIDQSYLAMNQMVDRMDQQRTDTQDLLDLTQHHQSDLNKLYMKQQMYFWRGNQGTKRHCGSWRSDQNTDTFD